MYFAKLDDLNRVTSVIVANQDFIDLQDGVWVQADINGVSPKNYPGLNWVYDVINNAFIAPKPYPSWILDSNSQWHAPISMPDDDKPYFWDEDSQTWK